MRLHGMLLLTTLSKTSPFKHGYIFKGMQLIVYNLGISIIGAMVAVNYFGWDVDSRLILHCESTG